MIVNGIAELNRTLSLYRTQRVNARLNHMMSEKSTHFRRGMLSAFQMTRNTISEHFNKPMWGGGNWGEDAGKHPCYSLSHKQVHLFNHSDDSHIYSCVYGYYRCYPTPQMAFTWTGSTMFDLQKKVRKVDSFVRQTVPAALLPKWSSRRPGKLRQRRLQPTAKVASSHRPSRFIGVLRAQLTRRHCTREFLGVLAMGYGFNMAYAILQSGKLQQLATSLPLPKNAPWDSYRANEVASPVVESIRNAPRSDSGQPGPTAPWIPRRAATKCRDQHTHSGDVRAQMIQLSAAVDSEPAGLVYQLGVAQLVCRIYTAGLYRATATGGFVRGGKHVRSRIGTRNYVHHVRAKATLWSAIWQRVGPHVPPPPPKISMRRLVFSILCARLQSSLTTGLLALCENSLLHESVSPIATLRDSLPGREGACEIGAYSADSLRTRPQYGVTFQQPVRTTFAIQRLIDKLRVGSQSEDGALLGTPEFREKISRPVVFHNTLAQIHFHDGIVPVLRLERQSPISISLQESMFCWSLLSLNAILLVKPVFPALAAYQPMECRVHRFPIECSFVRNRRLVTKGNRGQSPVWVTPDFRKRDSCRTTLVGGPLPFPPPPPPNSCRRNLLKTTKKVWDDFGLCVVRRGKMKILLKQNYFALLYANAKLPTIMQTNFRKAPQVATCLQHHVQSTFQRRDIAHLGSQYASGSSLQGTCEPGGLTRFTSTLQIETSPSAPLRRHYSYHCQENARKTRISPITKANRVQFPDGPLPQFRSGDRAGLCRWSAGFLGDLLFPPPFHSGASPYSLQSSSSAFKSSLLRAAEISSLTLGTEVINNANGRIRNEIAAGARGDKAIINQSTLPGGLICVAGRKLWDQLPKEDFAVIADNGEPIKIRNQFHHTIVIKLKQCPIRYVGKLRSFIGSARRVNTALSQNMLNFTVLYILELALVLHWLLRRCEVSPIFIGPTVIGLHNWEVLDYRLRDTQGVSDEDLTCPRNNNANFAVLAPRAKHYKHNLSLGCLLEPSRVCTPAHHQCKYNPLLTFFGLCARQTRSFLPLTRRVAVLTVEVSEIALFERQTCYFVYHDVFPVTFQVPSQTDMFRQFVRRQRQLERILNMPISTVRWLSAVIVEGVYWASLLQEESSTVWTNGSNFIETRVLSSNLNVPGKYAPINKHFTIAYPNHVQFTQKGSDFTSGQQPMNKRRRLLDTDVLWYGINAVFILLLAHVSLSGDSFQPDWANQNSATLTPSVRDSLAGTYNRWRLLTFELGGLLNIKVLYVLEPVSFLHWMLIRRDATPFLIALHVIGAHNCEVFIYWRIVTHGVSLAIGAECSREGDIFEANARRVIAPPEVSAAFSGRQEGSPLTDKRDDNPYLACVLAQRALWIGSLTHTHGCRSSAPTTCCPLPAVHTPRCCHVY
ncbi:hypothetical protein PR048_022457 [Dryococelus australis]|uniref:Uncharacterized protein n=1 Tax=Dryococelus australis TaxID=614101 RepID=A0ABQ9H110_9NEOP|nr:hypothetical protein PR048_022457 [Dryococelus australis]